MACLSFAEVWEIRIGVVTVFILLQDKLIPKIVKFSEKENVKVEHR